MIRRPDDSQLISDRTTNPPDSCHRMFGTDLVFLLASECGVQWYPHGQRNYTIQEISPLTRPIQNAIRILTRNCNHDYNKKFDQLLHPEAEERFVSFFKYADSEMSALIEGERHMFLNILYIARLSLVFHQRGFTDAPDAAAFLIAQTVSELNDWTNGFIYNIFSQYLERVVSEQS